MSSISFYHKISHITKKVFGGAMPFAITEQGVVMIRAWLETEEEQ